MSQGPISQKYRELNSNRMSQPEETNKLVPTMELTNQVEKAMTKDAQGVDRIDEDQPDLFEEELEAAATQSSHPTYTRRKATANTNQQKNPARTSTSATSLTPSSATEPATVNTGNELGKALDTVKMTVKIDRVLHGRLRYMCYKTGKKQSDLIKEYICKHCPEL